MNRTNIYSLNFLIAMFSQTEILDTYFLTIELFACDRVSKMKAPNLGKKFGRQSVFRKFALILATVALYMTMGRLMTPKKQHIISQPYTNNSFLAFSRCETVAAVQNKHEHVQLSDLQIMWVADMLHLAHSVNKNKPNLLVFGVGNDSPMWSQVNCIGRTVFVEDDEEWIKVISSRFPSLEVHHVNYNSSVSRASDFFLNPVEMSITSVDSECFDVILIDGPKGFAVEQPGRLIPAYYSYKKAQTCDIATVIFLHDVERPTEQMIAEKLFSQQDGWLSLGHATGPYGRLAGWVSL